MMLSNTGSPNPETQKESHGMVWKRVALFIDASLPPASNRGRVKGERRDSS